MKSRKVFPLAASLVGPMAVVFLAHAGSVGSPTVVGGAASPNKVTPSINNHGAGEPEPEEDNVVGGPAEPEAPQQRLVPVSGGVQQLHPVNTSPGAASMTGGPATINAPTVVRSTALGHPGLVNGGPALNTPTQSSNASSTAGTATTNQMYQTPSSVRPNTALGTTTPSSTALGSGGSPAVIQTVPTAVNSPSSGGVSTPTQVSHTTATGGFFMSNASPGANSGSGNNPNSAGGGRVGIGSVANTYHPVSLDRSKQRAAKMAQILIKSQKAPPPVQYSEDDQKRNAAAYELYMEAYKKQVANAAQMQQVMATASRQSMLMPSSAPGASKLRP